MTTAHSVSCEIRMFQEILIPSFSRKKAEFICYKTVGHCHRLWFFDAFYKPNGRFVIGIQFCNCHSYSHILNISEIQVTNLNTVIHPGLKFESEKCCLF
jgi:hypothetical protein